MITLEEAVVRVQREVEDLPGSSRNPEEAARYAYLILRVQRFLGMEYVWRNLRAERDITLAAGEDIGDFPADLDPNRISTVHARYNGAWERVYRGLPVELDNIYDRNENDLVDPPTNWEYIEGRQSIAVNEDPSLLLRPRFRVWPRPLSATTLRFVGMRLLPQTVPNIETVQGRQAYTLVLDPDMLVLQAAAEVMAGRKDSKAQAVAEMANRRLRQMVAAQQTGGPRASFKIGENCSDFPRFRPPEVRIVRVRG